MCRKIYTTKNTVYKTGFKPCQITNDGKSNQNVIWKMDVQKYSFLK